MSEPTSTDPGRDAAPERLHPLFLLTGLGRSLRGLAGAYAGIGYLAVSGRETMAVIGIVALLLFMAAGILIHWLRFLYRVGDDEIRIDSGIFSRTHRSIPFERIQDVDISQGPVARLLGLAQVKFETGSAAVGPNAAEAVLHTISLERAEEIRKLVRARRGSARPVATAEQDLPPVFAMGMRRLLLAGTFNFSLAVFAGLFGLTQTFGDAIGFDPLNRRFWTGLLSPENPIAAYVLQHRIAAATAGALLLVVLGVVTGIVRTVVRDYGFRLDRTEAGIRRRRGLLTRTDVTLPVRRAQAAIVATGPVRARFGWSELKLQSLARDEGHADHVLAPLASEQEVANILGELGWRSLPDERGWQRVSPAYVWTFAIGLSPVLMLVAVHAALPSAFAPVLLSSVAVLVALLLAVAVRGLAWRRVGYLVDGDRLLIRTGWWRRRTVVLPLRRMQSIDIAESFVSRRFGVATLRFGVAGGGIGGHRLPLVDRETARQLRDRLLGLSQ